MAAQAQGTAPAVTLRWAAQNDILTLDPHSQNHSTTSAILMHAYEGLVRYDADRKIEPALATKWTYLTPTQVRFELRRNVRFHDGSPFTADDVVFSFNRIRQPQGTMGIYVTGIAEIRKIDSHTVDFIMAAPNPLLLRNIVDFRIVSKAWAEKNKSTEVQNYKAKEENYASRNVMGTGPYMITGWVPDQRVTMKVNPNWWDKHTSNITDVVYTPIKSDPTRVAALIAGDVDLLTDLPTQDVARLRQDPKLKVVDGPEVRTIFLALDQHSNELKYSDVKGKNPFKDRRVREALSIVVDREAIKQRYGQSYAGVRAWIEEHIEDEKQYELAIRRFDSVMGRAARYPESYPPAHLLNAFMGGGFKREILPKGKTGNTSSTKKLRAA